MIKKILGQGGMGAALLATDLRLDSKPVVIKELLSDNTDTAKLQEDVRNFKREVATLAQSLIMVSFSATAPAIAKDIATR